MISREEIVKLANLSRLSLTEDEISRMQKDMGNILAYVDKLKSAKGVDHGPVMSANKNVLRDDTNAHEGGVYTEKLVHLAPNHVKNNDGLYVKVKKILGGSQ
jgi:aspartyl-tRNA(Asn)/glutamyl-tRNA(Gln) amidotransferase subunit C